MEVASIEQCINYGQEKISSCSDSAKLDAQLLLAFVLKKELSYLLTWPERELAKADLEQFLNLLTRRVNGEPIAYIVGVKEFWSLPFNVSPATLIPRPDTEVLVELVLNHHGENQQYNCLDLGTGTGAIALALASELQSWNILAVDYNPDAVKLAKQNAKLLSLTHVHILQSDWFSAIDQQMFDVIVSNPPYIDELDENLAQGDVRFEPKSALVAEQHGLADIKHIAKQGLNYLKPNGSLYFEHGFDQGRAVRDILTKFGYENAQTQRDYNGHERVTWANKPSESSPG